MNLDSMLDQHGNTIFFKKEWPENSYIMANGNGTYQVIANGEIKECYPKIEDAVKVIEQKLS